MTKEQFLLPYKVVIIAVGALALAATAITLEANIIDTKFLIYAVVTLLIASKMSVTVPRTDFHLSFSDSMTYLALLQFGGKAAIVVAALEMISTCYFLGRKGINFSQLAIPYNIASNIFITAVSYQVWLGVSGLLGISFDPENATSLFTFLSIFALSQFLNNSILASFFISLKTDTSFIDAWKKGGLSISVTHMAGAALAGVAFKLINSGDIVTTAVAVVVFAIAYFNYRHIMNDVTSSLEEAERAQSEKALAEAARAEQAEKHAAELGVALKEQEKIGSELRKSRNAFQHAALHDPLTKLPNRNHLQEKLEEYIKRSNSFARPPFYLLYLDLSRFKVINDSLGRAVGDKVLLLAAKRLLNAVNRGDFVARLGSDEFAVILRNLEFDKEAEFCAQRIFRSMGQAYSVEGNKIYTQPSIGITPADADHEKPEDILRDADIAMRHARENELEFALFDKELRERFLESVRFESELRFAVDRNEMAMFYQPLVSLQTGELTGFEALIRWFHPKLGLVPPDKFIPIAEESGLIVPITNWILKETTSQLAKWQKISPANRNLIVSVNISGKHLAYDSLIEEVGNALKTSKIRAKTLKLEMTESTAMNNAERTIEVLSKLKKLGVQLSIDDFGTGYSSLSYLHKLPFNMLKIDRSFVNMVGAQGENSEILQTIVSLAKNLKMQVIAEGIETELQLGVLQNLGCDYGQGYLFSRPLPKEEMENLLYKKQIWFPESIMPTTENDGVRSSVVQSPVSQFRN